MADYVSSRITTQVMTANEPTDHVWAAGGRKTPNIKPSRVTTTPEEPTRHKDGSKDPVRDQQEIDKELPKAVVDATPKLLTVANLSLKGPIVVTPKCVAAPVVIPEVVNTHKAPAVMPEEPIVVTPTATSTAPPKTAPSANSKETPNATPNETPVAAPTSSIATPRVPVATPRVPVATPRVPAATSVAPDDTPRAHVATSVAPVPSAPVATPTGPVATPRAPVAAPTVRVATSVAPVDTPSAPHAMPKSPTVTTPKSSATDQSANQQQQLVNKVCILCCHNL